MTSRFLSKGQNAPIGYRAQAGGAVTQLTNKATAVTINKLCGEITMDDADLATATEVSFVVNNNLVEENDVPLIAIQGGELAVGEIIAWISDVSAGSFTISISNLTGGTLGDVIIINFAIFKAVAE